MTNNWSKDENYSTYDHLPWQVTFFSQTKNEKEHTNISFFSNIGYFIRISFTLWGQNIPYT